MSIPLKLPAFTLTISSTAVNLRQAIEEAAGARYSFPHGANRAIIQVEDEDLRYLVDGNTPTTTVGIICNAGNGFTVDGDIEQLIMIRDGAADVTLTVQIFQVFPGDK